MSANESASINLQRAEKSSGAAPRRQALAATIVPQAGPRRRQPSANAATAPAPGSRNSNQPLRLGGSAASFILLPGRRAPAACSPFDLGEAHTPADQYFRKPVMAGGCRHAYPDILRDGLTIPAQDCALSPGCQSRHCATMPAWLTTKDRQPGCWTSLATRAGWPRRRCSAAWPSCSWRRARPQRATEITGASTLASGRASPPSPPFGAASSRRPSAVRKSARPVRAIGRASHADELRVRTTIPRCGSVV